MNEKKNKSDEEKTPSLLERGFGLYDTDAIINKKKKKEREERKKKKKK